MARGAIQDSDDEGDEVIVAAPTAATDGIVYPEQAQAELSAERDHVDNFTIKSTGSTERLRNQLNEAEQGLLQTSEPTAQQNRDGLLSSTSPSMDTKKRRHTTAAGDPLEQGSARKLKRTKTQKTYSRKGQPHTAMLDSEDDIAFAGSKKLRSASKQSSKGPSGEMPSGTIQADFMNHEPNAMFRDSGSTVADDPSAQQRLCEEAVRVKNKNVAPTPLQIASGGTKSSSFPWSPSQTEMEKTASTKKGQTEMDIEMQNVVEVAGIAMMLPPTAASSGTVARVLEGLARSAENPGPSPKKSITLRDGVDDDANNDLPEIPKLVSPVVRIPPFEEAELAMVSSKKRKTARSGSHRQELDKQTTSELLNSEDRAIGLPKELYKPRPTKRRATQHQDEPRDLSNKPEKAAEVKRRNTSAAPSMTNAVGASVKASSVSKNKKNATITTNVVQAPVLVGTEPLVHNDEEITAEYNGSPSKHEQPIDPRNTPAKVAEDAIRRGIEAPTTSFDAIEVKETSLSSQRSTRFIQRLKHAEMFAKPAPRAKPNSVKKRSHTTIFEDHLDFTGSQRSPSLRQQQEQRKSDLNPEDLPAAKERTRRPTRRIEDDDEDELGLDVHEKPTGPAEKIEEPPEKRGRGRPPKPIPNSTPQSAEEVTENVDDKNDAEAETKFEGPADKLPGTKLPEQKDRWKQAEPTAKPRHGSAEKDLSDCEVDEGFEAEEETEERMPAKRGRGRPTKAASKVKSQRALRTNTDEHSRADASGLGGNKENEDVDEPVVEPTNGNAEAAAAQIDQCKPTKVFKAATEQECLAPKNTPPAKGSVDRPDPTSHSPIKNSSKVPLRVGLSKRHKIQPLLRIRNI